MKKIKKLKLYQTKTIIVQATMKYLKIGLNSIKSKKLINKINLSHKYLHHHHKKDFLTLELMKILTISKWFIYNNLISHTS